MDRARERVQRNALFLTRNNIHGEHGNDRAVHRHRHAHFIERYSVEQDFHILDRINRHARLADIAFYARMVTIITAVRGQIKSDG